MATYKHNFHLNTVNIKRTSEIVDQILFNSKPNIVIFQQINQHCTKNSTTRQKNKSATKHITYSLQIMIIALHHIQFN